MREYRRGSPISALAALVVFCLFAAGVLSVLLSGAGVYRRLTQRDEQSYDRRTCVQVVATKVRQAPAPDSVSLSEFGQGPALVIREEVGGATYCTRLYCQDGWLMELFSPLEGDFAPEDGEKLLPAQGLALTLEEGLLHVAVTDDDGQIREQYLSLRGVAP